MAGLPHSGTSGSTPADGSPKLFAAFHALHRLVTPRHPPCAFPRSAPRSRTTPSRQDRLTPHHSSAVKVQFESRQIYRRPPIKTSLLARLMAPGCESRLSLLLANKNGPIVSIGPSPHDWVGIDSERRYTNLFSSGRVPIADLSLLRPLWSPECPSSIQTTLTVRQVLCIFPLHPSSTHQAPEVEMGGFEPPTSRVQGGRSPTELHPR